jgi:hypothetical protein
MEEARNITFGQRLHSTGLEMFVKEAHVILDLELERFTCGYIAFGHDRMSKKIEEADVAVKDADVEVNTN